MALSARFLRPSDLAAGYPGLPAGDEAAPGGANLQPWHFAGIADRAAKRGIRLAAEAGHEVYHHEAPPERLEVVATLSSDEHGPHLETVPYLIAIFAQTQADARTHAAFVKLPGFHKLRAISQ